MNLRLFFVAVIIACALMPFGDAMSDQDYRLGPGDRIDLKVWDERELSGEFIVGQDGTFRHPLVGDVYVRGQTIREVSVAVQKALAKDYLRDPRVTATILNYASRKVNVYGEVPRPGIITLKSDARVLDVLLSAGGVNAEAAREVRILRLASDGKQEFLQPLTVNLDTLLAKSDLSQNKRVMNGDIVYVPSAKDHAEGGIFIMGEVKKPGLYPIGIGSTALTAVLAAGGFTKFAAPNKTKLIRQQETGKSKRMSLRLGDVERGDKSQDIPVKAGDMIVVPESWF